MRDKSSLIREKGKKNKQISKRIFIILIMVVGAFMLTGCQIENPISVDSIRDNSTIIDYFEIQGFWNIDDIIMETRQTDKDERTDDLYCQIVVNDTKIKK